MNPVPVASHGVLGFEGGAWVDTEDAQAIVIVGWEDQWEYLTACDHDPGWQRRHVIRMPLTDLIVLPRPSGSYRGDDVWTVYQWALDRVRHMNGSKSAKKAARQASAEFRARKKANDLTTVNSGQTPENRPG